MAAKTISQQEMYFYTDYEREQNEADAKAEFDADAEHILEYIEYFRQVDIQQKIDTDERLKYSDLADKLDQQIFERSNKSSNSSSKQNKTTKDKARKTNAFFGEKLKLERRKQSKIARDKIPYDRRRIGEIQLLVYHEMINHMDAELC